MHSKSATYKSYTDERLIVQIAARDEWAFDELYDRYSKRMLHYFYKMLNQEEETAQDFLQDLFMKIVEKSHSFNSQWRFSTWVYSIASNMCKNEYRSRNVRKIMTHIEDVSQLKNSSTPEEFRLDRQRFEACLTMEIEKLPDAHREVFILRFQQELSIKEIAGIMKCAEGTIKSRIFYSLKKLSQKLQAFNPKER